MQYIESMQQKGNTLTLPKVGGVVLILLVISLAEWMLGAFTQNVFTTNVYILQLLTVFSLSYFHCVRKLGVLHIFSLLHVTTFIFALGSLVMSFINPELDFRVAIYPLYMKFSEPTVQKVILLYTIYFSCTFIVFFAAHNNNVVEIPYDCLGTNDLYLRTGKLVMWISFPVALLYAYTMFKMCLGNRAMIYASGSNAELGMPLLYRLGNYVFHTGYYILVASIPKRDIFVKYSLLYIASLVPLLLLGERGTIVAPIIFLVWYQYRVYNHSIKFGKLAFIALVIMVLSYVIMYTRLGESVEGSSIIAMLVAFLGTSSTSFKLLGYYVTYKAQILTHPYPFIFDSLIGGLTGHYGQSLETLEYRSSIGHHLVYTLNPDYYLSGASTGTSLIAEGYEFGVLGVIFAAILLVIFMYLLEKHIFKGRFRMIYLVLFFNAIILSPRNSLFVGLYDIIKYGVLVFFLLKCSRLIFRNRTKSSK